MPISSTVSVVFPSAESADTTTVPSPRRRQHLLSFRRISHPTAPNLLNRQSSASLISHKSLPEENGTVNTAEPSGALCDTGNGSPNKSPTNDANKRQKKSRNSIKPLDEGKVVRRKKVIAEFYNTERAYVEGLDLIYSHFLTPLIESLDTSVPLLGREDLIAVFSNFIDIWNLHRSFFTSLTELLSPSSSQTEAASPPLSSVLISHFPYLSLYTPFVSSFSDVMSKLSDLQSSNVAFDSFIKQREADERCGKLKLRDWLLTVVQRCPRYLLLLKDLINCTDLEDPERSNLIAAHSLLEKVTTSLDTSLHTHAQTLSLLALQRATHNLPIQLVSPGRTILKRGTLMQQDNSSVLKEREFLLFSDCLVWLANDRMIEAEWLRRGNDSVISGAGFVRGGSPGKRPEFKRTRSKSENAISDVTKAQNRRPPVSPKKANGDQPAGPEERWWFKGKAELIDTEVVITTTREPGAERRLEILNPEMSFALYADSEQCRDEWVSVLRAAKSSLLGSLNVMHPNSTLASSTSINHIRRSLQALPYLPEEDEKQVLPKRGKVDHFVPAIWVPDAKTDSCMRCGRAFGWRRRRHHCRLCGRCICAGCSDRTFFIADPSASDTSKSARACTACYDTVFPLIESSTSEGTIAAAHSGSTLSSFPSWRTQKPVPLNLSKPSVFMELEAPISCSASPSRRADVIRKPKGRPFSHPVIPQLFPETFEESLSSEAKKNERIDEAESRSTVETGQVLGDISNSSGFPDIMVSRSPSDEISSRARKRFSMPALALQTTSVTAHPKVSGEGSSKRISLVLGSKQKPGSDCQKSTDDEERKLAQAGDLGHGIAIARLQELLGRTDV